MSSNPVHDKMYLIQYYVIKFVGDMRQVNGFSPGTPVSSTNKTDHNITEILFKVELNTITLTLIPYSELNDTSSLQNRWKGQNI